MKILVVDDSRAMRLIVKRTLRQAGFGHCPVVEAANGNEALDVIAREQPELVLSDWNMPEMNGIELLEAVRGQGNGVHFGFVTSLGSPSMQARASAAGASFFITKPFTADSFQTVLGRFL